MSKQGYLVLANGRIFKGERFGAVKDAMAEVVFTTGMTGYIETLTDPSYDGQIVTQTFPTIGNYGIISEDFESAKPRLSAYIVREACDAPSNFRCEGTLDAFLKANDIPGLCQVDTRALTKIIRDAGVMNGALVSELPEDMDALLARIRALPFHPNVKDVTCAQSTTMGEGKNVVLMDFGAKANIERELVKRGCRVTTVSCDTSAQSIKAMKPDGVMLSNGPGDPKDNGQIISEIKALMEADIPMFGICLGHQLMALAAGAQTGKLKYGHRGANQPAKDLVTDLSYMTSQNHGFAVDIGSLPETTRLRFINGNDGTCEGIDYVNHPAFSVQFHPEACGGSLDTLFLFDRFIDLMGGNKNAAE